VCVSNSRGVTVERWTIRRLAELNKGVCQGVWIESMLARPLVDSYGLCVLYSIPWNTHITFILWVYIVY